MSADVAPEDMGRGDVDVDPPDSARDQSADALDVTPTPSILARLEPFDLGLGAAPADPMEVRLEWSQGRWAASLVWPAGTWRLSLSVGEQSLVYASRSVTGLRHQDVRLVEGESATFLNGVDAQVRLSTDGETLTIERQGRTSDPRWDTVREVAGAGAALDEALATLDAGTSDGFEVVLGLLQTLRRAGAGPMASSAGVLMLTAGSPEEPAPEVRGEMTGWDPDPRYVLRPILGRLYGRFVPDPEVRTPYKIVFGDGAAWFTDLGNRNIAWDGFNPGGVGAFNSVLEPKLPTEPSSRMVWVREFASPELSNQRELYVLLPTSYDSEPERRYPVLYVHDGNESIVRSQFHEVIDAWSERTGQEMIAVFIGLPTQGVRLAEYTMATAEGRGDQYAMFVAQTLVRFVDRSFRTVPEARARGVVGASLGGLISFWIGARHPEVFEYIAGMSSSFWWEEQFMVDEIDRRGCQGLTYYLDSGSPGDGVDGTRAMRDTLVRLGCRHTHVEEPGGAHDWSYWRARFPGVLDAFASGFTP